MTDEMMSLRGLLEKSADADVLREMIGFAAGLGWKIDSVSSMAQAAPRRIGSLPSPCPPRD